MEQKIVTANGINIYCYQQPNTHSICISLYVKAGTLYENQNNGITHFLEHIHFRNLGGKKQKELYYELESIGADFQACTYKELMRFYFTSDPKYFQKLSKIAAGLLLKLETTPQDFAAERRLILSEIREDNQKNDVDFVANKYIWEQTNLQNPILGTMASIKGLTLEMLQAEKERIFTRQNIFYYITGCFNDGDLENLATELERINLSERPNTVNSNFAQIPANFKQRHAFAKIFQRSYFMHDVIMSFDIDFNDVSRPELLYLDSILTDGLCSLLREEMIEKRGLIYSIQSTIDQYNNIGTYYFNFTIHKGTLYEAINSFIAVIKALKQGLPERSMQTTRIFKTDNQMQLLDNPDDLNWRFAYENHILENNYPDIAAIANSYNKITEGQLVKIANKIFIPNNCVVVSIGNKKGLSERKLHEILLKMI
jgi:predicted Zn-dependent peptidase